MKKTTTYRLMSEWGRGCWRSHIKDFKTLGEAEKGFEEICNRGNALEDPRKKYLIVKRVETVMKTTDQMQPDPARVDPE